MSEAEKSLPHSVHLKGRVSYYDPDYKLLWLEGDDHAEIYVQTGPNPLPLRTGQYVGIDGTITPSKGLRPDEVTVTVISEVGPVTPLDSRGRISDLDHLGNHVAIAEGYVDQQLSLDEHHVRLALIAENRPVICWVYADDPAKVPDWLGHFVRISGLYSGRFDSTHTTSTIEFWLGGASNVQVLGSLDSSAGFRKLPTPIAELYKSGPTTAVHVRGRIEARRPGTTIVVRDSTGEVEVRSLQQQRLKNGAEVDVLGQVAASNDHWVLDPALYVPVADTGARPVPLARERGLESSAQIRALGLDQAFEARPVVIRGMVAWQYPDSDYFVLLDRTGAIRVYYDHAAPGALQREKFLEIRGVTRTDRLGVAVSLHDYVDLGSINYPVPKPITVNEALAGGEDGGWVEMRGFISKIETTGQWRAVNVTTPDGRFAAKFRLPFKFAAAAGALIRADGVCETLVDPKSLETTVSLLVPGPQYLAVEEEAPRDLFQLPLQGTADLARAAKNSGLSRVHIAGIVRYAVAGQSVYLEDGNKGLLVLGRESLPLYVGERVEAVGVLGEEGARVVLRDAVFRQDPGGPEMPPLDLADTRQLDPGLDNRLVRTRGTLIDVFRGPGKTRLTLRQGDTIFDATLDQSAASSPRNLATGASLEVIGLYQLIFDDFRRPRGFQMLLRSPGDVRVIETARFWTIPRALFTVASLGVCVVLGLIWIVTLRRRVRIQTDEIRVHAEKKARLEADVQRAGRLESLGRLAGGIAHEYNNLLTVITGNISLMKLNPVVMAQEADQVLEIEKGTRRARAISKRLLTFSVGGDPVLSVTDLAGVVREAAEKATTGTRTQCSYSVAPDLEAAAADPEQVAQAVEILVRAAAQAVPQGGTVRISLANVDIASASPALAAGRYVRTSIVDEGEAIPAEELPRIFDPFSPTKRDKSGLDLSTVYSIVKKHHGHIEAISEASSGVTFTFWLPVAKEGERSSPTSRNAVPIAQSASAPRVLVMDDEESIRRISSIVLEGLGIDAVAVPDGSSALKEFSAAKESGRPFSLLVFDLTIPEGLGGLATIEAIRKTDALTPAIVCSGYSSDPVMANFSKYGFQAALSKPYELANFSGIIKDFLVRP